MNAKTTDNSRRLTPDEIDGSLAVLRDTFKACRSLILDRAGKTEYTSKQDGSPVTDTDVEVEKILMAAMEREFPGVPIYGEESGYAEDMTGTFWLVDPVDGTKSFVENIPTFTSMGVLIQDGEAVASVIYNISTDEMYIAQKGRGAYRNGTRLDLSNLPLPEKAYCKARFIEALDALLQPEGITCHNGPEGAGHGFTMVANGTAAARFNLLSRGYIHDYAPGALLVREAGGVILPVKDDTYNYATRSFIACHPSLEPVLRPHLQEIRTLEIELAD
ncbi:MAG TPA: inositol monophosphatase family protein [Patescibacteria group bacterium]|nr:inositol monophosphatase family protein [Patescibacteria group bacterium]